MDYRIEPLPLIVPREQSIKFIAMSSAMFATMHQGCDDRI